PQGGRGLPGNQDGQRPQGSQGSQGSQSDQNGQGAPQPPSGGQQRTGGGMGGPGGSLDSATLAYLKKHKDGATWLRAVANDQSAASAILAGHEPVISMGGWSGSDDAMTLAKLKQLVKAGKLHYVQVGGSAGPSGSSKTGLTDWITKHGTKVGPKSSNSGSLYRLDPSDVG
ncbi:hypothetical protein G5C65_25680, partial [Streptomyces sp. SB3404]|nr:hypothetical protein [Streptomyces boncukensis]